MNVLILQGSPRANGSTAWHSLNDAIAEMALASGGTALYVRREHCAEAPLQWRFRTRPV